MSIATHAELLTAIQTWEARADTDFLGSDDDFVTMCEARIAYGAGPPFPSDALRIRAMETAIVVPLTVAFDGGTAGGTADVITLDLAATPTLQRGLTIAFDAAAANTGAVTINAESTGAVDVKKGSALSALAAGDIMKGAEHTVYHDGTRYVLMPGPGAAPLPTDFLGLRSLYIQGSPQRPLEYIAPQHFDGMADRSTTGKPSAFTIQNDALLFATLPDTSHFLVLNYYRKFGALSAAPNWLILNAPNVYLYGSMLEAMIFNKNWQEAQQFFGLFRSAVAGLSVSDQRDRYGGSPLVQRTAYVV